MGQKKDLSAGSYVSPRPFKVFRKSGFLPKTLGETRQQHFMRLATGRGKTVVHPQALFSGYYQSGPSQIGQVP
jgi:hypothetical protein